VENGKITKMGVGPNQLLKRRWITK
jgi:hypothetical protein